MGLWAELLTKGAGSRYHSQAAVAPLEASLTSKLFRLVASPLLTFSDRGRKLVLHFWTRELL